MTCLQHFSYTCRLNAKIRARTNSLAAIQGSPKLRSHLRWPFRHPVDEGQGDWYAPVQAPKEAHDETESIGGRSRSQDNGHRLLSELACE